MSKIESLKKRLYAIEGNPNKEQLVFASVIEFVGWDKDEDGNRSLVFQKSEPRWVPKYEAERLKWLENPVFRKDHDEASCTEDHPCRPCQRWKAVSPS